MGRFQRAAVVENLKLSRHYSIITLKPETVSTTPPLPGQFYMLAVTGTNDPLLKRPFCVLEHEDGLLKILYRIRGRGTALLSAAQEGAGLDLLGPLGNSYRKPPRGMQALVVAGGTGIASVFPLIKSLKRKARVFYGAKTAGELVLIDKLERFAGTLLVSTEDGSFGASGTAVDGLGDFMATRDGSKYVLYTCGPRPMMEAAWAVAREKGMKGYASLEENMACGFGACQGCAVLTPKGYKRVCREGPVFRMEDIIW